MTQPAGCFNGGLPFQRVAQNSDLPTKGGLPKGGLPKGRLPKAGLQGGLPKAVAKGGFPKAVLQKENSMAEQNVPAQPPTRTDEQIVPRSQWLTIGKSNLLFNAQKIQKNPIFQISVDILKNTNFFQALTASANVPAIYLQQFWKTMSYMRWGGGTRLGVGTSRRSNDREPRFRTTPKQLEVEVGKGKAVVTEEQVAHSLVTLSKKKRTTDQFVFARRDQTPPDSTTGPSSQPEDDTLEKVVHESSSTSDTERTKSETQSGTPKGDQVSMCEIARLPKHQDKHSCIRP
ncbi:hypothetical protein Tco_0706429 [Tanacetum coccineum]|uniref:Uncharacterized protein n=1 Tax=Tanacetum coccineum TaxID=301880 RepID=A0ABQ4Y7B7_9ASTR